jgi:aspartate/methionine/tyrosine aminotransferase
MFSSRVPGDLQPNRLTLAVRTARARGRPLLDLTLTNPTVAGIAYPPGLLQPLASEAALGYNPAPFGLEEAREAVALEYRRSGIVVATERIVLTASTSEAYSLLFKLLCTPGDAVLVPVPSYPLFDHLTRLDGVRCIPYRLEYHGRWGLELDQVDAAWLETVRAVLVVSPNNPTGSVMTAPEMQALATRCAARGAALIVDEVFADYPLAETPVREARPAFAGPGALRECLSFRLGGLSKSAGLPQVKLGWIVVDGPEPLVSGAIERLEIVCDAYLSVSTPVQVAARALIASGESVRSQILARVRGNYARLSAAAAAHPATTLLPADAGWSAVLRVPSTRSEEDLVIELLEHDGVLVHPGFFFDFPQEAYLVVSLLPEPHVFAEGVRKVLERADA